MKRTAQAAMVAVAFLSLACPGKGDPIKEDKRACPLVPVKIEVKIGPNSLAYKYKTADPVPGFLEDCEFEIVTHWLPATTDEQTVTFSDFKDVEYQASVGPTSESWETKGDRMIYKDGSPVEDNSVTFQKTEPMRGTYTLPSSATVVTPRLIFFTVTLRTANGTEVTFDPPWSEKKR